MTKEYVTADEYLSGNVRQKLRIAQEFAQNNKEYEINVKALERVKIKDLSASEISVRLGATWIPASDIEEFIFDLLKPSYYVQSKVKVDTQEIKDKLNNNINQTLNQQNLNNSMKDSINTFVDHICNEYTDTMSHFSYENKINETYIKAMKYINIAKKIILNIFIIFRLMLEFGANGTLKD